MKKQKVKLVLKREAIRELLSSSLTDVNAAGLDDHNCTDLTGLRSTCTK